MACSVKELADNEYGRHRTVDSCIIGISGAAANATHRRLELLNYRRRRCCPVRGSQTDFVKLFLPKARSLLTNDPLKKAAE